MNDKEPNEHENRLFIEKSKTSSCCRVCFFNLSSNYTELDLIVYKKVERGGEKEFLHGRKSKKSFG